MKSNMEWVWTPSDDKKDPNPPTASSNTHKPLGERTSLNSDEDHAEKRIRNLDGIREEQGVYGLPEVEVSPDYETDEDVPIKGANLPFRDTIEEETGVGSETGLSENPPLSAKSAADALEEDETLDDFVRKEKEIAQELEESGEFEAGQLQSNIKKEEEHLQTAHNPHFDPDSGNGVGVLTRKSPKPQEDHQHDSDYENDSDYPEEYPKDPPPAYTSPRKSTGLDEEMESSSAKATPTQPAYILPGWDEGPPTEFPAPSSSKAGITRGLSTTSVASGIGGVLAAGGVAAALVGAKGIPLTSTAHSSSRENDLDDSDDMEEYTDNIRDKPEAIETPKSAEPKPDEPEKKKKQKTKFRSAFPEMYSDEDEDEEEDEEEDEKPPQKEVVVPKPEPEPEPEPEIKYPISSELKGLFHMIEEFAAEKIEIETILKPFLLDFIPAVGDVDPFIKIPRPDEVEDNLGLIVLDEPAAAQSDPTIISMQLQQSSNASYSDAPVKKVIRADKNTQQIEKWIENIKELRRGRPPDRVSYGKPMPDIERLMQEWNPEMEAALKTLSLPTAKLDASLEEYVDLCLGIVDIPVHKNRIHSLHLLFSLYAEFKNSQHFRNLAANNLYQGPEQPHPSTVETNRLELL
uniref:Intraflagellar transport protein 46 homolog n=1 Tax=Acrobeloides nanus TaxID=290746 RepID=A0A914CKS6_9BILA